MFFQGNPWRLVPPPPAGAQMPPALLGCRQARLRLSAGQRGRSGVSEPTGAASLPSPVDLFQPPKGPPLCQLPQRPCGREAGGGAELGCQQLGAGVRQGRKGQTGGRGWATSRVFKARSRGPCSQQPHTHTPSEGPCPYQISAGRGSPCGQRSPVPGLVSAAAAAMESQVLVQLGRQQLLTQVLSFCGEEARGRTGREGGDSRREGGGKNAEVLKGTLTFFLGFPW